LLPLCLQLVEDGVLSPLQLAQRLALEPARVLGVQAGSLSPGARANLVLVNPAQPFELRGDRMLSAGRNTPFLGRQLPGRASLTLHAGTVVYGGGNPR
jgi:dihydroorotase